MRNKYAALAGTLGLGAAGLGYHLRVMKMPLVHLKAAASTLTTTPTVPTPPQVKGLNANQATAPTPYTPPATSTSLMDTGISTGINGIINTGEWGIKNSLVKALRRQLRLVQEQLQKRESVKFLEQALRLVLVKFVPLEASYLD